MNKEKRPTIFLIIGSTASGKSDLAVYLAKKINGECINADATQIYQGLDLATNKITLIEQQQIPHHLLSFIDLNDNYSISDYQVQGRKILEQIWQKQKNPIIVGGSGLYINALLKQYNFIDTLLTHSSKIEDFSLLSNFEVWKKLEEIDPEESKKIHYNNRQRVLRAITIFYQSGLQKSLNDTTADKWFYQKPYIIGLNPPRELLHQKIALRVKKLIDKGLITEVLSAYKYCNFDLTKQSMKIIGCREIVAYSQGKLSYEEAFERMIIANRQYARKQMTWFNHQLNNIHWYEHNYNNFADICEKIFFDLKGQNIL